MDAQRDNKTIKKVKKYKRQQNRWSSEQIKDLLQALVDKLKDAPEKFEKPTASSFYEKLFIEYNLSDLSKMGVIPVKNKVRNLKDSFIKAEEWKGQS